MREDTARQLAHLLSQPIAHRGLHACGRNGPVENSLGAAKAAVAAGYAIECDVLLSRDGEAMVFHDAELERLTRTPGRLDEYDAAELRRLSLRGGPDHVPSLSELLAAIDGSVPLVIEIKTVDGEDLRLADRTMTLVDTYPGPVALESFDARVVHHCRQRRTKRPLGLIGPPETGGEIDREALAACDFLSWSIDHIVEIARYETSLPRTTWTVRTLAQQELAARYHAQIVFEDVVPSPTFNGATKD